MNKLLLAFFLSSSLISCDSHGREFNIVVPDHPHGGPRLAEITWWAAPDAPEQNLKAAAREWTVALACGAEPRQVSAPELANIKFVCGHIEFGRSKQDPGGVESGYLSATIDKDGTTTVMLDEWCNSDIARSQALHVWGHALGYPHQLKQFDSVLGSEPIIPIDRSYANLGIRGEELDNIRIWALAQGAPGCGAADPQWNWEKLPKSYRAYPDVPVLIAEAISDRAYFMN